LKPDTDQLIGTDPYFFAALITSTKVMMDDDAGSTKYAPTTCEGFTLYYKA
jgi:hypothetical protein